MSRGLHVFSLSRINACAFHPRHEAMSAQCAPQRPNARRECRATKFGVEFCLPATTPPLCLEHNSSHFPVAYLPVRNIYAGISIEATTIPVLYLARRPFDIFAFDWSLLSTDRLETLNDLLPPKRSLPQTSAERTVPPPKEQITNDEEPAR